MGEKMEKDKKIIIFKDKKIRRILNNGEWYFSIIDVVFALTDSNDSRQYIKKMRQRDSELQKNWGTICTQVKMIAQDGKKRFVNCANKEGIFRIIQSIPSKRAEPFKLWLAKVGSERIDEIENPELLQDRLKEYYEKKDYPKDWVDKRIRGIAVRQDLTNEWKSRGVGEGHEYAILTNEISMATFGVPISEHKGVKGLNPLLKNENLRDNMTDLELIFSMLGEASTTEIVRNQDIQGFDENKIAASKGGMIAGDARIKLEKESNSKIVSPKNNEDLIKLDKNYKNHKEVIVVK